MNRQSLKLAVLASSAALAVPAAAGAQVSADASVHASADTAQAQHLAAHAPAAAQRHLARARAEFAAAYRRVQALEDQGKASAAQAATGLSARLRRDAQMLRTIATRSSGTLRAQAAKSMQSDIQMQGSLALNAPDAQQPVYAQANSSMTGNAVDALHATPARLHAAHRAFAQAVADGLDVGRAIARRAAAKASDANAQGQDLLAQIHDWAASLAGQLAGSGDGQASVNSPVSGSLTLSVLAGQVADDASADSSGSASGMQVEAQGTGSIRLP